MTERPGAGAQRSKGKGGRREGVSEVYISAGNKCREIIRAVSESRMKLEGFGGN